MHNYPAPPNIGSFNHFWRVSPVGEIGEDFGEDLDAALRHPKRFVLVPS